MAVIILGSINMDLVVQTPRFPRPGETLIGHTFFTAPGGKGANQAVAAAKLGVPACMVGRVGKDVFGDNLLESLQQNGVDISSVMQDDEQPSGTAVIFVDDQAENEIVIVAGANGTVGESDLDRLESALQAGGQLLLQLEVPMETVVAAARLAHEQGVTVIFDPAPVKTLPDELYAYIDIITPNESEASALVGFTVDDEVSAGQAAQVLQERGARQVVVKMGSKGAYWHDGQQAVFLPAFKVDAVDTVAAGDAFNGALAAGLSEGLPMQEALRWGMAGGAISTTRIGAQPSLANREELLALLQN
ncbi:MAG: ribokinase [Anaerolineaceae bacterium]|nr:ribokinase [Anaerolineaceae bacterium]